MFTREIIIYPLLLIFILTLVHILLLRMVVIKKQIFCIFFLFLAIPFFFEVVLFFYNQKYFLSFVNVSSLVLYTSLAVMYLQMFPGAQARSPSALMMLLPEIRTNGLEKDKILSALKNESMLEDRLEDLVNDGFAYRNGEGMSLRLPGKCMAIFFYYYRQILGLPQGKG